MAPAAGTRVPKKATLPAAPRVAYGPSATLRVREGGTMQLAARPLTLAHAALALAAEAVQCHAGSMPERITGPPLSCIFTTARSPPLPPEASAAGSASGRQLRPPSAEKAAVAPEDSATPAAYSVVKSSAASAVGSSGTQPRAAHVTPPLALRYAGKPPAAEQPPV